jgi:hypothetical protein
LLLKGKIVISPQQNYFFSIVLACAFFIFGNKLIVAQTVATLIGALAVVANYFLAKEVFVDRHYNKELGFTVTLLISIALMAFLVYVKNDPLFLLFFILACYYALKGTEDQKYLKFTGIFTGLAYLTRDPGILLLPVFIVYVLLNQKGQGDATAQTTWKEKFMQYKNLLLMVGAFLLFIAPKLFWRWYFFGDPFYVRNTNFWWDNYEDRFNSKGYLPNSFDYQPSLTHYLQHHTLQQITDRWLLGMYNLILALQGTFKKELQIVILLFLILVIIGLFMFRKKRDLLLHLNIAVWFFVFSWLFAIRPIIRWIIPMYPLMLILAVGVVFEVIIRLIALTGNFLEFHPPAFIERFVNRILGKHPSFLEKSRLRRLLRINLSTRTFFIFITLYMVLLFSLPIYLVKAEEKYATYINNNSQSSESYRSLMEMVNWAKTNTAEDAKFMARDGHDLLWYYAHREAIITPNGNLSLICWVIRNEGVDYLVIDSETLSIRPALKAIFEGNYLPEGYSLVYKNYEGSINDKTPELKIQVYATN